MKRKIVGISILCLLLGSLFYVYHTINDSRPDFASNSTTVDLVFHNMGSENDQFQESEKTGFTWKDSKGDEYPVYMSSKGSCFVIRTSKNGENYKAYLGKEVSEQICRELKMKEKRNN